MNKILVTCPPMLGLKSEFIPIIEQGGYEAVCPDVTQTLSENELIQLLPSCVGWIIGDDPATRKVIKAGFKGNFRAAVKWGIGVDNVDFDTCEELGIPISNTPGMFGNEVADIALNYLLGLARETYFLDRQIRKGEWPKNRGISLTDKTVAVVGYGDIGRNTVKRCQAFGMKTVIYDPIATSVDENSILKKWPEGISKCDFIILTCSLTNTNRHMLNANIFNLCKSDVRIINVARGPLICEMDLEDALITKKVHSAALDVFEEEPLPMSSRLRNHPLCIFGSHNSSNTIEAVRRTNKIAIEQLLKSLKQKD
jgi:D-3-phosphoglycerate dehydrogenase